MRMSSESTKSTDKIVLFRADAGKTIGYGHIMRCLSLAHAMQRMGVRCIFVSGDSVPQDTVTQNNFEFISLESGKGDVLRELDKIKRLVDKLRPCLIVVDSYRVTRQYLQTVRSMACLVYIDDMRAFPYPCDVLVNYNIYGPWWREDYQKTQEPFSSRLLLGTQYAPLRKEFAACPRCAVGWDVKNVLVSTGGTDVQNVTRRILTLLKQEPQLSSIEFHFLVGALNPYKAQIEAAATAMKNVKLYVRLNNISELMQTCDMAISAAGSTLYELCACGTPTITYILADNQISGAKAFAEEKVMLFAGDCRHEQFECNLLKCMSELIGSYEMRKNISAQMQNKVDGFGADRLAKELLKISAAHAQK